MKEKFLLPCVGLTMLFGGCVLHNPVPRNSRFAVDISQMQKVEFIHDTWMYRHPTRRVKDYPEFLVNPVKVFPTPVKKLSRESRERYDDLAQKLQSQLEAMIMGEFHMAGKPGPNVLSLNVAIIDIKPIIYMKEGGNEVVRTNPYTNGTKFELDAIDSGTNELIFAISTLLTGDSYARFEDPAFVPVLDKELMDWVRFLADRLK